MRIRTLASLGLMAVGVGAVVFVTIGPGFGTTSSSTRYLTGQATLTDVVDQVSATGSIAAAASYTLSFGSAPSATTSTAAAANASNSSSGSNSGSTSWTVTDVRVQVGQAVKAGDQLASADPAAATLAVTVAEANLAAAKARLASDKSPLTKDERAAAKLQVTQANKSLASARSSYSSTVRQNNLKLRQARAALARARKQLADDKAASQPSNVLDQDASAITQASDSLASLKLQVAQANTQAAGQVDSAKLSVTSAQYAYKQKIVSADAATLQSDQAAIAQAEQALATAKTTLGYATLVAPADGIVTAVNIEAGAAAPSGAAITLRSAGLEVSGSVAEADLPSLKLDQDVTITLTALATDTTGKVVRIDQTGASSSSGGVVSYGIVVSLPDPPAGTAPGMSATISITTQAARNVVAVPAIALQAVSGQYSVRVLDVTGQPQSVPVEVGLVTSSLAEIKSGLDAGTAVVIGTSSARQGTSSTTTTGLPGLGGGGAFPGGGGRDFRP